MLFNSIEFAIFLPIVIAVYWLSSHRIQNKFLLLASYVFYGAWDVRFLFLIVLSTGIDFLIGLLVSRGKVTRSQYLKATGWIFLSAFLYLFIKWPPGILEFSQIQISALTFELLPIFVIVWAGATLGIRYLIKTDTAIDKRIIFVGISVTSNLAILGFFKYFNFFVESAET